MSNTKEKIDSDPKDSNDKAKQLPVPSGYHLLCIVPEILDKYDNSVIIKADSSMKNEEALTTVLFVLRHGPDAYQDKVKFPSGAWCKEGDFVIVRPHAGSRLIVHGKEFRIINDDSVEGTVEDPRGIRRK